MATTFAGDQYLSLRRLLARRQFESDIDAIIRTCTGHKKNKVHAGAPQYQSLWRVADGKVDRFCREFNVPRLEIEAQIPALRELENLSHASKQTAQAGKAGGVFLIGAAVFFLFGIGCYFGHWLFTAGWNLAERIFHWL